MGVSLSEPLNAEQVIALCEKLQKQSGFSEFRTLTDSRHNLLYRTDAIDIKGISQKLENLRTDLEVHKDRYVNRMDSAGVRIGVTARSNDKTAIEAAQNLENFLYALHHYWTQTSTGDVATPDRSRKDQAAAYGLGVLRLDFSDTVREKLADMDTDEDDELIAAFAELFKDGLTEEDFAVSSPDIRTCFFEPDFSVVGEMGERTVSHLLDAYPDTGKDILTNLTSETMAEDTPGWNDQKVKLYHLETNEYIYDVVCAASFRDTEGKDGHMLERRRNIIGYPWYCFNAGIATSERSIAERYRPLIGPLYPIVQELQILGTLLNSGALQTGRVVYQLVDKDKQSTDFMSYVNTPLAQRPTIHVNLTDHALQNPPAGKRYEPMPVPDQQWLLETYRERKHEIQEYGFPAPLSPDQSLQASASSGYHAAREMEQASMFIEPALKNLARADHKLFMLIARLLKKLDIPMRLPVHPRAQGQGQSYREMVTIKPQELREQDLTVGYEAKTATVDFAMREANTRELQAGTMSRSTYMVDRYEDPLAEETKIKLEAGELEMDKMALEDAIAIVQEFRVALREQAAAEVGVPLPANPNPPPGGPAPGEETRNERPEVPMPGIGAPVVPPEPVINGMPASVGSDVMAP